MSFGKNKTLAFADPYVPTPKWLQNDSENVAILVSIDPHSTLFM